MFQTSRSSLRGLRTLIGLAIGSLHIDPQLKDLVETSHHRQALRNLRRIRERFSGNAKPIVLDAVIGPREDAYRPEAEIAMEASEDYFTEHSVGSLLPRPTWLAPDLQPSRSRRIGSNGSHRRSARGHFVHGRDQRRMAGWAAPVRRDQAVRRKYQWLSFLFRDQLRSPRPLRWRPAGRSLGAANSRCPGQRSRRSHAELDSAPELDPGNPTELAGELADLMPWLSVFGDVADRTCVI
jgi:hypothetical protein